MNATPMSAPTSVRTMPMSAPSQNSAALAPSMKPAAIEFEIPSHDRLIRRKTKNGSAPRPVASAVRDAATKTVQTFTSTRAVLAQP